MNANTSFCMQIGEKRERRGERGERKRESRAEREREKKTSLRWDAHRLLLIKQPVASDTSLAQRKEKLTSPFFFFFYFRLESNRRPRLTPTHCKSFTFQQWPTERLSSSSKSFMVRFPFEAFSAKMKQWVMPSLSIKRQEKETNDWYFFSEDKYWKTFENSVVLHIDANNQLVETFTWR